MKIICSVSRFLCLRRVYKLEEKNLLPEEDFSFFQGKLLFQKGLAYAEAIRKSQKFSPFLEMMENLPIYPLPLHHQTHIDETTLIPTNTSIIKTFSFIYKSNPMNEQEEFTKTKRYQLNSNFQFCSKAEIMCKNNLMKPKKKKESKCVLCKSKLQKQRGGLNCSNI